MNTISNPLELLQYIQTIFPDVEYLAEDEDGECYVFYNLPMVGVRAWIVISGNTSNFLISEKLSSMLVWEHKDWTKKVVSTAKQL